MRSIPWFALLWLLLLAGAAAIPLAACSAASNMQIEPGLATGFVRLAPGDDVAAAAQAAAPGTLFLLTPGVYRNQRIVPRDRQAFVGPGAVLSGAVPLADWRREDGYWVHDGLPEPLHRSGKCTDGGELCQFREDLFVRGLPYRRVSTLQEVAAGTWYYEANKAYLLDDSVGAELSVTPEAFTGSASGVLIRDLTVEKYASQAQSAAISGSSSSGWTVRNVTARWNHSGGLVAGDGMRVIGGSYSDNGQIGLKATGRNALIAGVEIARNNYAGFDGRWEAGGTKFYRTRGLRVVGTCAHHNHGPGLWLDIDNIDYEVMRNRVFNNDRAGIHVEISYRGRVGNNVAAYNGGAQIYIQNSQGVVADGNVVEVAADRGRGIVVLQQYRGSGAYGLRLSQDNRIRANVAIYLGLSGWSGAVAEWRQPDFHRAGNNIFDWNTYVVPELTARRFRFGGQTLDWPGAQAIGNELNGRLIVRPVSAVEYRC